MTSPAPELLPCPFPHTHQARFGQPEAIRNTLPGIAFAGWRVVCMACEAEGPVANTEEDARASWNTRRAPASLGDRSLRALVQEFVYAQEVGGTCEFCNEEVCRNVPHFHMCIVGRLRAALSVSSPGE